MWIDSGLLRVQHCPAFLQHQGSMGLGWPGPSGTSMACCKSLCWRMRGSGKTERGQHWDALPTPSCSSTLGSYCLPIHPWVSAPVGSHFPWVLGLPLITRGLLPTRKEMRQLRNSRDLAQAEQRVLAQQVHELER